MTFSRLPRLLRAGAAGVAFLFALASCSSDEPEDVLPERTVRITLRLDDAEYTHLQNLGEFLEITSSRGLATAYLGVGGVLVVHSMVPLDPSVPFAAYDMACPYCYYRSDALPRPRVYALEGGMQAVCEECGSVYDISQGFGNCIDGPGSQLQVYHTVYSSYNRILSVTN
jgi:hypothetical protein